MADHAKDKERLAELAAKLDEKAQEIEAGLPAELLAAWHADMDNPEAILAKGAAGSVVLKILRDMQNDPSLNTDDLIDRLIDMSLDARDKLITLLQTAGIDPTSEVGKPAVILEGLIAARSGGLADLTVEEEVEQLRTNLKGRFNRLRPLGKNLCLPADRVVSATMAAFIPGNLSENNNRGFFRGYTFSTRQGNKFHHTGEAEGVIGYADNPGEVIWQYVQRRGAMLAKLQLAFWARVYHETDVTPGQYVEMPIVQLCDDLGYKRHKGGHRREHKIEVGKALDSLFDLEIEAHGYINGKRYKMTGPLWSKGIKLESEELFDMVPVVVRFAPGDWFNIEEWRRLNGQVATMSAGALKLSTEKNDQAALFLACYFATLARMNGNEPSKRLKARTLAEKSGLVKTYKKPGALQKAVEGALGRLVEVGVIKDYPLDTVDTCADPNDFDNPETLATLAEDGSKKGKDWLNQVYIIKWPDEVVKNGPAIAEKREKHIKRRTAQAEAAATRRARRGKLKP